MICLGSFGERVFINTGQYPFLWNFDISNILTEVVPAPKATYSNPKPAEKPKTVQLYEKALNTVFSKHALPSIPILHSN